MIIDAPDVPFSVNKTEECLISFVLFNPNRARATISAIVSGSMNSSKHPACSVNIAFKVGLALLLFIRGSTVLRREELRHREFHYGDTLLCAFRFDNFFLVIF